jgi:hypothetical protein
MRSLSGLAANARSGLAAAKLARCCENGRDTRVIGTCRAAEAEWSDVYWLSASPRRHRARHGAATNDSDAVLEDRKVNIKASIQPEKRESKYIVPINWK